MIRIVLGCLVAVQILGWPLRAEISGAVTNTAATNAPAATPAPAEAQTPAKPLDLAGCVVERFTVNSPSMGRDINVAVILPPGYAEHPEKKYPVLYTLHGSAAAYDCFASMSTLLSGLKDKPMVVAMFDADTGSFYIDTPLPQKWSREKTDESTKKSLFTTFFFDEYVPALDKKYRIDTKHRMLTGFSMGGYGAFHYMLAKPEMFCSVSSMSGTFMDESKMAQADDKTKKWLERLYGPMAEHAAEYQALDEFAAVKAAAAKGVKLPPIRLTCGTEDRLLDGNKLMRDLLKSLNIPCEYEESPGKHEWKYWKGAMVGNLEFHWKSVEGK